MIQLHAVWGPGRRVSLWAEAPRPATGRAPGAGILRHPFATSVSDLAAALRPLGIAPGESSWVQLRLPSGSRGPVAWNGGAGATELRSWRTPAIGYAPWRAIDPLMRLGGAAPPGIVLSPSVQLFARLAERVLELIAAGRVVPELAAVDTGFVARWRPAPRPEDEAALRALAAAMPPACRAAEGALPSEIVEAFVADTLDQAVRGALRDAPATPRTNGPAAAWLRALRAGRGTVDVPDDELRRLAHDLHAWQAAALSPTAPFRTCFRLLEPGAEGGAWEVEFLLQAIDDPSLLVPAAEIWASTGPLQAGGRDEEAPQEHLLRDLGRARRLWPELEDALSATRPERALLDVESAHRFLREAAPVLAQAGFGVLLPSWWRAGPQIGLRMRAQGRTSAGGSARDTGTGLLGAEGLCDYRWQVALGDEELSSDELHRLAALKVPLVRVRGRWVEVRPDEIRAAEGMLERTRGDGVQEAAVPALLRAGLGLDPAPGDLPILGIDASGWLGSLLEGGDSARVESLPAPPGFIGELRPYQERGLGWLHFLDQHRLGGCLADDMGLGKTVQVLALLLAERDPARRTKVGPTLLVCPMSVVGNWQREAQRFAPQLAVHVHHGSGRRAGERFAEAMSRADVVITTYPLAARDRELLASFHWHRIVLDEAQNVKNSESKQAQAVRSVPASRRLALTGTPIENRLSELWSIMTFCNPGLLGGATDFRTRFAIPIERYRDQDAAELLRRVTGPFVLRRLKTDRSIIDDLPAKLEMNVFCSITREQATLYQAILDDMLARVEESEGIERRGLVLATMMKLKQVLNHPAQLLGDGSRLEGRSGKLSRLVEVLEEAVEEGDRALVFTQFAQMGTLLRDHIAEQLQREVLFLHGGTPKRARDEMVDRFQSPAGPPVFVLSLKAGGTGLNLTAANHVIHFDRWWNPAVEAQATDRAFRIGQRRDVQVRKFICAGTLEERIDQMIESKKELAERIVGTGEGWLTELDTAELRRLVALAPDAVAS